ncbi:MAG: phosphoribosylglycinamide formyltransferase [Planctomycetota bacterium]
MTRLPIAVLISGGGTTLRNLIRHQEQDDLPVDFRLVVSSNPQAGGIDYATDASIPVKVIERNGYATTADFSQTIFDACSAAGVQLVVMGGFLKHVLIPDEFTNRVINIHPSMIPNYCGKGFYGKRVHQAVIDAGESESGCTVHFVDDEYDHGPVVDQKSVPVLPDDTAESLAARVFEAECRLLPSVIARVAKGEIALGT